MLRKVIIYIAKNYGSSFKNILLLDKPHKPHFIFSIWCFNVLKGQNKYKNWYLRRCLYLQRKEILKTMNFKKRRIYLTTLEANEIIISISKQNHCLLSADSNSGSHITVIVVTLPAVMTGIVLATCSRQILFNGNIHPRYLRNFASMPEDLRWVQLSLQLRYRRQKEKYMETLIAGLPRTSMICNCNQPIKGANKRAHL